jgi:hypothetical protein
MSYEQDEISRVLAGLARAGAAAHIGDVLRGLFVAHAAEISKLNLREDEDEGDIIREIIDRFEAAVKLAIDRRIQ